MIDFHRNSSKSNPDYGETDFGLVPVVQPCREAWWSCSSHQKQTMEQNHQRTQSSDLNHFGCLHPQDTVSFYVLFFDLERYYLNVPFLAAYGSKMLQNQRFWLIFPQVVVELVGFVQPILQNSIITFIVE